MHIEFMSILSSVVHTFTDCPCSFYTMCVCAQLMKLIDLLVALTVSEDEMYPLIQAYIWTKIGKEVHLLKKVSLNCECVRNQFMPLGCRYNRCQHSIQSCLCV